MPTYPNGRIPDAALSPIPGGGLLLHPVAATWALICAEVSRDHGWTPVPTGPLDSYRPYSGNYYAQVETFLRRHTTTRLPGRPTKVWNGVTYWLRPGEAAAAVPGTSNHGWACAVDVAALGGFDSTRYRQLAAAAARHGWTNTEGASIGEPWHWVDVGTANLVAKGLYGAAQVPDVPAVTAPDPLSPTGGDMSLLIQSPEDGIWLLDGGVRHPVSDMGTVAGLTSRLGAVAPVSTAFLRGIPRAGADQLLLVQAPGRGIGLISGGGFIPVQEMGTVGLLQTAGVPLREVADAAFDALTTGSR